MILLFARFGIAAESHPSWFEHVDLMQVIIAALFSAVVWSALRTLKKIDDNQTQLFNRMNAIEKDFSELKGQHEIMAGKCKP